MKKPFMENSMLFFTVCLTLIVCMAVLFKIDDTKQKRIFIFNKDRVVDIENISNVIKITTVNDVYYIDSNRIDYIYQPEGIYIIERR